MWNRETETHIQIVGLRAVTLQTIMNECIILLLSTEHESNTNIQIGYVHVTVYLKQWPDQRYVKCSTK